jgi:chromosome segregation ATPase
MSINTTDIEKKSLEAHVDLCAERYRHLDQRIAAMDNRLDILDRKVDEKIDRVESILEKIISKIEDMQAKRNAQLESWATAIIGGLVALAGTLAYMLYTK